MPKKQSRFSKSRTKGAAATGAAIAAMEVEEPKPVVEAPAAPVMATRRAAPVHTESTSNENVVTYVAVVDSPAGEYGVARQNND